MKLINPLALARHPRPGGEISSAEQEIWEMEGFESRLEPLKDGLYGFILKSLGFNEDAADVYQETVLRAFKYRKGFKRDRSFKTWIFSIANNEVRRYFRKAKHTLSIDRETIFGMMPGKEADKEQRVYEIFAAAAFLTERQKRMFFLFYESGFSIREIAQITGTTENNVKVTLNQSRARIRSHLGGSHET